MAKYREYSSKELTKEILDTIKVGDLIKINGWRTPLRVYGVSENYFVMARRAFGKWRYSVCEKRPFEGLGYNNMVHGFYHFGRDDAVFGTFSYEFDKEDEVKEYMEMFESGELGLSFRCALPIHEIQIKTVNRPAINK